MSRRDPQAFAEFVAARSGALHRAAYLMVGDAQLAQDLVQEALTKTYVAWPRLREPARSRHTPARRSPRRRSLVPQEVVGRAHERHLPERRPAGHADEVDQRDWLWQALQELPARQRAAIVLRFYEDLTEAQTADGDGLRRRHRQEPGLRRAPQAPRDLGDGDDTDLSPRPDRR